MLITIAVLLCSCREIEPLERFIPVNGYKLEGTITTPNGIPLDSVEVKVSYTYDLYQTTPLDTVQVLITDSTKIVHVAVYNYNFRQVRQLFLGFHRPGVFPNFRWDERDDTGKYVPSGKYFIRYTYDTVVVKVVSHIAEGHTTAITDRSGRFTLTNANLPIGEIADFYRSNGSYRGTFIVRQSIKLKFLKDGLASSAEVTLARNKLVRKSFILG